MKITLILALLLLKIQISRAQMTTVTEAQFESLGTKIYNLYAKKIQKLGVNLSLQNDWQSTSSNAYLNTRNLPYIDLYYAGGLVKKKHLSYDALALILCHEMGHLLGKKQFASQGLQESAAEGEADYFAANDCLPNLWKNTNEPSSSVKFLSASEQEKIRTLSQNQNTKFKILAAGYESLQKMYKEKISYSNRDQTTSPSYRIDYPSTQCRLDTYLAGALNLSRPKCWVGL